MLIDAVLELLAKKELTIKELLETTEISEETLTLVINLLCQYSLAEKAGEIIKITSEGEKFLELSTDERVRLLPTI
ncbi:MAG: hypothetical protein J7J01_00885 [Methanophagales archaeon]|nr:hypothetical protein [Methanophagales archaeon]